MAAATRSRFDIIVIGGGAVGLSCAWHATRLGRSVLVLEQFDFLGDRGSSAGAERQWRIQYAHEDLARLALEARSYWHDLEQACGRRLVFSTGSLWFGDVTESTNEGQITTAADVLDRLAIKYEWLGSADIERRFHFANLPGSYEGFYQADGGIIDVKATLWALYELARGHGAVLNDRERALELVLGPEGVDVRTSVGNYHADHVIVCAGPFSNHLMRPLGVELDIALYEMPVAYFRQRQPTTEYPTWFVFQKPAATDSNLFYGFGRNPWSAVDVVRVAPDFEHDAIEDPYRAEYRPKAKDLDRVSEWVRDHMPSLDPQPLSPTTCMVALPRDPDRELYIGRAPTQVASGERLAIYSAGWAFKFVPLLGRACLDIVLGEAAQHDLMRFAL